MIHCTPSYLPHRAAAGGCSRSARCSGVSLANVWLMSSGNRMVASPWTLTGLDSGRSLPHDIASSGRAPAHAGASPCVAAGSNLTAWMSAECSTNWWPRCEKQSSRLLHVHRSAPVLVMKQGIVHTATSLNHTAFTQLVAQGCATETAPESDPSNSWAVLMNTAKSAPFLKRFAFKMWCLGTPAPPRTRHLSRRVQQGLAKVS